MLSIAFKEWAVICRALAVGRQSLILRKGGISEHGGAFRPEHDRFWLYPSYFHEHRAGVRPEMLSLLEAAEAERPPAGTVRLAHFAAVEAVHHSDDLEAVLRLAPLHGWSEGAVRQRFHYRKPGLFVLVVRIYRAPVSVDLPERPEYAGCKTWVSFDRGASTDGSVPVAEGAAFAEYCRRLSDAIGTMRPRDDEP